MNDEYCSIIEGGIERALVKNPDLKEQKGIDQLVSEAKALIQSQKFYFSHESKVAIGSRRQTIADFLCDDPKALRNIVSSYSNPLVKDVLKQY